MDLEDPAGPHLTTVAAVAGQKYGSSGRPKHKRQDQVQQLASYNHSRYVCPLNRGFYFFDLKLRCRVASCHLWFSLKALGLFFRSLDIYHSCLKSAYLIMCLNVISNLL